MYREFEPSFLAKLRQETFPTSREKNIFLLIRPPDVKARGEISGTYPAPFPVESWNPLPMHVQTNNLKHVTVPQFRNVHTSGIIKNENVGGKRNYPPVL
ncbi:hypothetical protein TNIN_167981, partial [Trichonephila inaurata madagascariensis]